MKKKLFITVLCLVFLFGISLFINGCAKKKQELAVEEKEEEISVKKEVKNPDTIIQVQYGTIQSLDPHRAYDTASGQADMNMYDTLIVFDGSSTDEFIPFDEL